MRLSATTCVLLLLQARVSQGGWAFSADLVWTATLVGDTTTKCFFAVQFGGLGLAGASAYLFWTL